MPKQIADYVLTSELGAGNHGTIYIADCPPRLEIENDRVAVKVLDRHATDDDFRRFANEITIFATVDSDHLVDLYDAGQQDGTLFYSMEFFPRGSLAVGSGKGGMSVDEILRAVIDAARGAHALHEVGVAHRDIKPTNILLSENGARLADLGLAQVLNPGQTVTGTGPIGSIEFMDPAVVRGEKASRASDIWQLATTTHKALTGRSVYGEIPTGSVLDALRYVLHASPEVHPDLPDGVRDCLERALSEAPEDRQPTAEKFAEELEEELS